MSDIEQLLRGRLNDGPPLLRSLKQSNAAYAMVRQHCGFKPVKGIWLTEPSASVKFSNTSVPTWGWSGLPNTSAWKAVIELGIDDLYNLRGCNTCGNNSPQCTVLCLNWSGKGRLPNVQKARLARTLMWTHYTQEAATLTVRAIGNIRRRFEYFAFRPNVLTDIKWETTWPWLFEWFSDVNFYDYTKHWDRPQRPFPNYYLTYSADETRTIDEIRHKVLNDLHNVAVVVDSHPKAPKPSTWAGMPVINGDDKDRGDSRFLDETGHVILLSAKGRARENKYKQSKFVWPTNL
jgi:hypothetical protein